MSAPIDTKQAVMALVAAWICAVSVLASLGIWLEGTAPALALFAPAMAATFVGFVHMEREQPAVIAWGFLGFQVVVILAAVVVGLAVTS